ncbi:MAG TPA: hypothetical protein VEP89_05590, partial [Draconibacterium sp.]|nr:hypothetical protein [Draconibacterium sp.]
MTIRKRSYSMSLILLQSDYSKKISFRNLLILLVLLTINMQVVAQNFGNRPRTPNDDLVSFEVNDDGSATFR